MRIFVTGGTGFIGGTVARKLLARGDSVIVLARDLQSQKARALEAAGAVLVQGDITDKESMRAGMDKAEVVYHLAGWYNVGVRDRKPAYPVNVDGTRNVLELATELGVPRIVDTASSGIYGSTGGQIIDPPATLPERDKFLSEYDRTKYLAYKIVQDFVMQGAPVVTTIVGFSYGPDDHSPIGNLIRLLLQRKLPMLPGKDSGGSLLHIEDTADGVIAAADKGATGKMYMLGGDCLRYEQVIAYVGEVSGVRTPPLLGTATIPLMVATMTPLAAVLPIPEHFHPETFASLNNITYWLSHQAAVDDFGFNPRPYKEGLRETVLYEMDRLGRR